MIVTQLHDLLAAEHSAKVPDENEDYRSVLPKITEAHRFPGNVLHNRVRQTENATLRAFQVVNSLGHCCCELS